MIFVYNAITLLLLPIYILILIWRLFKKKEDLNRIWERFGISSQHRPKGEIFWLHAASVGESNIIINLVQNISINQDTTYLVTSGTLTSARILKNKLPANIIHQFLPYDNFLFVYLFLKKWRPYIGIFIEAEIWPGLIHQAAKTCKLLLINAHISDKSFNKWKLAKRFFQQNMNNFSEILTQSMRDFEKYKWFEPKNLTNIGNIKFSNKKLEIDDLELQKFARLFQNRTIIFLASTHLQDEQNILSIVKSIRDMLPKSYFIIAPRHPERRAELARQCDLLGITYSLRSKFTSAILSDDLYIIDNFGDLGLFYSLANVSFVGGSFVSGGHNPLEPAHFRNFILLGPNMSNYQNITDDMLAAKAALQFQTTEDFFDLLKYYLSDENYAETLLYRDNSLHFVQKHQNISDQYLNIIKKYI
ncbi:MAG: 3-deoxy-D-manno-octulosonic acid transferase [Rickettsiaceae bacterium]|nr:MAG: 3-deoxy-D-manno-octulosonic acid transferase [Rickettsiaceae bacterium]